MYDAFRISVRSFIHRVHFFAPNDLFTDRVAFPDNRKGHFYSHFSLLTTCIQELRTWEVNMGSIFHSPILEERTYIK